MEFGIEVTGDRLIALRFDKFPDVAREAIRKRIEALTQQLLSGVHGREPSLTGRLRGETQASVSERSDRVRGNVGVRVGQSKDLHSEAGKAAALEYGARGSVSVKAHSQRLTHVYDRMIQPMAVFVDAYTRTAHINQLRYLRGPADALRGRFIEEIRAAITEAIAAG